MNDPAAQGRRQDLAERLERVRRRIADAARAAGRETPELIVVTKFFPASDVRHLSGLGVRAVGENRDQEAAAKAAETADLDLEWHFIGQLQKNKAKSVVRYASAVHSVDREPLVGALARAMEREQERRREAGEPPRPPLTALVQVDLDQGGPDAWNDGGADAAQPGRGGAAPDDVSSIAAAIAAAPGLELGGVMAVAPLGGDPDEAFERLRAIALRLQEQYPEATAISAGMSQDLESAVAHGATHLRIGSDVLGPRPAVR
ncbi:YggS family pyridoxal phosphate-dependent enzyme [Zhihengliuella sp.]|uniref:YggS family pyridoxal phosphate-dependent enzyme n=1 Tax=Zhihengliuella sp. TaxID=1954483 RepID=UPI002811BA55|nr:YggS family pyridoxal phosphate-dependent enzyme [Zhihengliuella sp.]